MKKTANKNLEDFFYSIDEVLKEQEKYDWKVSNCLLGLFMQTEGISEKAFEAVDEAQKKSKAIVAINEKFVKECENKGRRPELCSELIYEKIIVMK